MSWEGILKDDEEERLERINSIIKSIEIDLKQIKEKRFKSKDKYKLLKSLHGMLGNALKYFD